MFFEKRTFPYAIAAIGTTGFCCGKLRLKFGTESGVNMCTHGNVLWGLEIECQGIRRAYGGILPVNG